MTTTVEAIYEHGKLLLPGPLALPEKTHVRVTIECDTEREAWMKLSEASLLKTWDNDADDVYNEPPREIGFKVDMTNKQG